jgi:mannose-6-phosphate isomerase-like protein (cupin superfamily)
MADIETFELSTNFLHLGTNGATPLGAGPAIFANIPPILATGRLVSLLQHDSDWQGWERHPAGDEVIVQLTGRMRLRLELPEGEALAELSPGRCVIVPKGVWHTADVAEPGSALYITEGYGTENRAR